MLRRNSMLLHREEPEADQGLRRTSAAASGATVERRSS